MSLLRDEKCPPLNGPQRMQNDSAQTSKEMQDSVATSVQTCSTKKAYRYVFDCFISAFRTTHYERQPLFSAIKKEYENTLALQRERAQIGARREKKRKEKSNSFRGVIEAMEERKKTMPTVVDHLQSGLSSCYLEYQDASRLLIQRLSELGGNSVMTERPADENTEGFKNPVGLQLALKVCREELKKTQEELISIKADYRVLQCSLETLNQNHEQTLLQLKTLQGDVEQPESDYDTLLQSHKRNSVKTKTYVSTAVQVDLLQSGLSSCYLEYRDASRLLIQRLSELGGNSVTTERPADENTGRP